MFTLTETQKEQRGILDEYKLNLKRKLKNKRKEKNVIENSNPFDGSVEVNKLFANIGDFIIVKNFIIERLKGKFSADTKDIYVAFIEKLNLQEIYVLSNNLKDFLDTLELPGGGRPGDGGWGAWAQVAGWPVAGA